MEEACESLVNLQGWWLKRATGTSSMPAGGISSRSARNRWKSVAEARSLGGGGEDGAGETGRVRTRCGRRPLIVAGLDMFGLWWR